MVQLPSRRHSIFVYACAAYASSLLPQEPAGFCGAWLFGVGSSGVVLAPARAFSINGRRIRTQRGPLHRNREVREIKNAAFGSCGVLLFDGNRPFDRGHRRMASIREAPWNKRRFSKFSLVIFRSTGKKVLRTATEARRLHVLAQHALYCSSLSSAEVAVLVGGYSQVTSQLRSSPWRWRQQDARPPSGTSPHGPHRPLLPAASDSLWVAGYTCSSSSQAG